MKKILVLLLMVIPLLASAQSVFTVESNGEKYTFPLEGTTITITESSEDSKAPTTEDIKKNIIGVWQATHLSGWFYDDNDNLIQDDKDITEGDDYAERELFKDDGTCTHYDYSTEDNKWVVDYSNYKYEISGNNLIIYDEDNEILSQGSILSINSTTMVAEFDPTEGRETGYKAKMTYTKISK